MAILTAGSSRVTVENTGYTATADTQSVGNPNAAGGVFLIKYTKGSETGYAITVSKIYNLASTTDIYKTPTTIHGALAQVSGTVTASGNWEIPVAALGCSRIILTFTVNGVANGTTAFVVDFIRDNETGK